MKIKTEKPAPQKGGKTKKQHTSWQTTDDHEIELRKERVSAEPMRVEPLPGGRGLFKDYIVARKDVEGAAEYRVELRSLTRPVNTCYCPDFRKNFLGTCKHIEKVKSTLTAKTPAESPFTEIFMERSPWRPKVMTPAGGGEAAVFVKRYLTVSGELKAPADDILRALLEDLEKADETVRSNIRVSAETRHYLRLCLERKQAEKWREEYARRFRESGGAASFLRQTLYDYQIEGALHLAFTGRALLADEMGLGKTVQAVAAAAILKECFGVERVLVVTPASLKSEWEEQIRKFTALPVEIVYGARNRRLETYLRSRAFFLLVNYEQVMVDRDEINRDFQPGLVILDEAQRIKNWKTQTAGNIKRLESRFAFILTGTPLENRIDELYSLVEFADPSLFGSLFRFNRRFYNFDSEGKIAGLKNLRELHETVKPVMLRRRKSDISEQLPERVDNNYFTPLTPEQKKHYADNEDTVARLAAAARKRPLTPEEFDRMQKALARMRMVCDSVYILDSKFPESPKIEELMRILDDIWEDEPGRKVIIFSEWVRMLELAERKLEERGMDCALHTGKVTQEKRRAEINRFKNDAGCAVFLSSDSGATGLNLQAASVVINLDLPWNPARLEQRIARAWRKHQKNTVNVINLVAENTIEHRMLATLDFKKGLSDAVLDARGDFADFEREDARGAFLERLGKIMSSPLKLQTEAAPGAAAPPPETAPHERLARELTLEPEGVTLCRAVRDKESGQIKAVLAVGSSAAEEKFRQRAEKALGQNLPEESAAFIPPEHYALLQKLARMGVITINTPDMVNIFESETAAPSKPSGTELRLAMSRPALTAAERRLKMASVLRDGGFAEEAAAPARQAVLEAAKALYIHAAPEPPEKAPEKLTPEMLSALHDTADRRYMLLLQLLCQREAPEIGPALVDDASGFVSFAAEFVSRKSLS